MKAIATRGKSSMGWFFGCKLHLIMNQSGDIVGTALSNENTADIKIIKQLAEEWKGKIYADSGYISHNVKQSLKEQGVELIIYHRKNMQAVSLSKAD